MTLYSKSLIILSKPNKELALPNVDVSFKLSKDIYDSTVKAALVLQVPEIGIVGDGSKLKLQAYESKNNLSEQFSYELGDTDQNFSIIFKVENFSKLMSTDYNVSMSSKGLSKFVSDDEKLVYHIAIENNSTFNA